MEEGFLSLLDYMTPSERNIMPPKKPRASPSTVTSIPCAVCANAVTEDGEDRNSPVTCSVCKETSHRYCAGVTIREFKSLSEESPYISSFCFKTTRVSDRLSTARYSRTPYLSAYNGSHTHFTSRYPTPANPN